MCSMSLDLSKCYLKQINFKKQWTLERAGYLMSEFMYLWYLMNARLLSSGESEKKNPER